MENILNNYNHYIRTNENGDIIKAYSTAFIKVEKGDILIKENADRHFNLSLFTMDGYYKYKYNTDKKIVEEKTESEIYTDDILKQKEIEKVINDLEIADLQLNRSQEDIINTAIKFCNYKVEDLPVQTIDRINNKISLRDKLKTLQGEK